MIRDAEVRDALRIAPSTLRGLIADGRRAGIAPPLAVTERLRRWRGECVSRACPENNRRGT